MQICQSHGSYGITAASSERFEKGFSKYRPHPSTTKQVGSMATHLGALNHLELSRGETCPCQCRSGNFSRYLPWRVQRLSSPSGHSISGFYSSHPWDIGCASRMVSSSSMSPTMKRVAFSGTYHLRQKPGFLTGRAGPLQTRILDFRKDVWSKGW